jgi:hypothetical protein
MPGETVLLSGKGYLYTEKPSVWSSAQGKGAMQATHYLTNHRLISEPKKMGMLTKMGLFALFGPFAAAATTSDMNQSGDAVSIPLPSIISTESHSLGAQRMIKVLFNMGGQRDLYFGLNRKKHVNDWITRITGLRYTQPGRPQATQQPYQQPPPQQFQQPVAAAASGDTKFCVQCGTKIPRSAKFCSECGARQ